MNLKKEQLTLYAITDHRFHPEKPLSQLVEDAILGGATIIQYREKNLQGEALKKEALEVLQICRKHHIPFIMNDYVSLAKEIDADGVHVGQSDLEVKQAREILGPGKIIGVTAKTPDQAKAAYCAGADYLGSGAIFGTTTKQDAKPMSRELLLEITDSVPIPVVAIGGIDETNIEKLQGIPIAGVAVISGIFAKENVTEAAKNLLLLFTKSDT